MSCVLGVFFSLFSFVLGFMVFWLWGGHFHFMGSCLSGLGLLDFFFLIFPCLSWVNLFVLSLKVLVIYVSMHIIHV